MGFWFLRVNVKRLQCFFYADFGLQIQKPDGILKVLPFMPFNPTGAQWGGEPQFRFTLQALLHPNLERFCTRFTVFVSQQDMNRWYHIWHLASLSAKFRYY